MGYRAGVPHIEEPVRNAADLSQTRRDHPRPRLLQLPRPGAEKGTGGPHRRDGRSRAIGVLARDPRRPRLADRDRGRTGREAFRPALAAPPRRELGAARRRRRPAAHRASAPRRLTRSRQPNPKRSATALFQRRFVFVINALSVRGVEDQSKSSSRAYGQGAHVDATACPHLSQRRRSRGISRRRARGTWRGEPGRMRRPSGRE